VNFTSILMSVFRSLATSVPKNLAICHQTPTLIGCIFLMN